MYGTHCVRLHDPFLRIKLVKTLAKDNTEFRPTIATTPRLNFYDTVLYFALVQENVILLYLNELAN